MEVTAGDLNKIITTSTDTFLSNFDYDAARKKYFSFLNEFCKEIGKHDPWTRETQKQIFKSFSVERDIATDKSHLHSEYGITLINNVSTLIVANRTIEVLAYEDCFDVFVDAHVNATDHGGYQELLSLLEDHYSFHKKCLKLFMKSCNVCGYAYENKDKGENDDSTKNEGFRVQLDVLDLINIVGVNPYRYLLVYIDNKSDYTILRALNSLSVTSMGGELMKIFTDFGPPSEIQVMKSMVPSFNYALSYVRTVMKFVCHTVSKNEPSSKSLQAFILLKDMIVNQKTSNIITSCYFTQKTLNCINNDGVNPTQKLFGKRIISDIIHSKINSLNAVNNETIDTDDSNKCHICNEVIFNKENECEKCNQVMHLACGVRLPAVPSVHKTLVRILGVRCVNCYQDENTKIERTILSLLLK